MKSGIASRLFHPLKAKVRLGASTELAAETELGAFYRAVRANHGSAIAANAAEHWLRVFASAAIDPGHLEKSFRKITIAAASLMATEITQAPQNPSHPFLGAPCPATSVSGCR